MYWMVSYTNYTILIITQNTGLPVKCKYKNEKEIIEYLTVLVWKNHYTKSN